jgi:hypothetical protein
LRQQAQQGLVSLVDTIEVADGDRTIAMFGFQVVKAANKMHVYQVAGNYLKCSSISVFACKPDRNMAFNATGAKTQRTLSKAVRVSFSLNLLSRYALRAKHVSACQA